MWRSARDRRIGVCNETWCSAMNQARTLNPARDSSRCRRSHSVSLPPTRGRIISTVPTLLPPSLTTSWPDHVDSAALYPRQVGGCCSARSQGELLSTRSIGAVQHSVNRCRLSTQSGGATQHSINRLVGAAQRSSETHGRIMSTVPPCMLHKSDTHGRIARMGTRG